MSFLILGEQIKFKLLVAGALRIALSAEGFQRIRDKTVGFRDFEAQGDALGLVFHIDFLKDAIDFLGEMLGLFLRNLLVLKFIVKLISLNGKVGESDEETSLHARSLLSLMHCIHELLLIQLFARDGDNSVQLLDKMYGGSVLETRPHFHQVVHIVAVQSTGRSNVNGVSFALFQLVKL